MDQTLGNFSPLCGRGLYFLQIAGSDFILFYIIGQNTHFIKVHIVESTFLSHLWVVSDNKNASQGCVNFSFVIVTKSRVFDKTYFLQGTFPKVLVVKETV